MNTVMEQIVTVINPTGDRECIIKGVKPGLVKLRAIARDGTGVYNDAMTILR
jgi:hypothetical protein